MGLRIWRDTLPRAGGYRPWLGDRGSLTRRLQARCQCFSVRRLAQTLRPAFADEWNDLGLGPRRLALIREVLLCCGDTPLVFAHSVIPRPGLTGPWQSLSHLGNKPLGAALFADPLVTRHRLQFKRLDARHPLYQAAAGQLSAPPRHLWARRSLFTRLGHPLLVTEIFLPEVLCLP